MPEIRAGILGSSPPGPTSEFAGTDLTDGLRQAREKRRGKISRQEPFCGKRSHANDFFTKINYSRELIA
jgi:hypothetical protein